MGDGGGDGGVRGGGGTQTTEGGSHIVLRPSDTEGWSVQSEPAARGCCVIQRWACVDLKDGGGARACAARSQPSAANAKMTSSFHPEERGIYPHVLMAFPLSPVPD